MKKALILLLLVTTVLITACTGQKEEEVSIPRFNVDEGKQIINNYLIAIVKSDKANSEKYLYGDAKNVHTTQVSKINAINFFITEASETEGGADYHGKIIESKEAEPFYVVQDTVLSMTKTPEGSYVISNITLNKELTLSEKNNGIFVAEGGSETSIISNSEIPDKASPQDAPDKEFAIQKKFGSVALSPDKSTLLFTTKGTHAFLARYSVDSKQLTPIDLYFEGSVNRIAWSPNGQLYAIERQNASGTKTITIYDAMSDNKYEIQGGKLFDDPDYNLSKPFFVDTNYYFFVDSKDSKSISGWWVYNFKNKKLGKLLR